MERIVLGIDPGTATTGYGIIIAKGNKYTLKTYGVIRTKSTLALEQRLKIIYNDILRIIRDFEIKEIAVEEIFFSKNVSSAIAVAQARGVILLAAAKKNIKVFSYKPNVVKQSLTGYGNAVKSQIQEMVKRLLKMKEIPKPDDAADAIAIALCHINTRRFEK